jgi:hypothetical protein
VVCGLTRCHIISICGEEVRLRCILALARIRWAHLARNGTNFSWVVRGTPLLIRVLRALSVCRVEVCLHVRDGHYSVPVWGAGGPTRIAITPVIEENAAALIGYVLGHVVEELAVYVEGYAFGSPVEAVLVKSVVWAEGKMLDLEAIRTLSSVAVRNGFRALEYEVDSALGSVELVRKKFHIYFLRVVVELD